jgi:hypothetical protein
MVFDAHERAFGFFKGAHRIRGLGPTQAAQAVVGTEVLWRALPFLRGRVRAGGSYRFVFSHPSSKQPMAFSSCKFFDDYRICKD